MENVGFIRDEIEVGMLGDGEMQFAEVELCVVE